MGGGGACDLVWLHVTLNLHTENHKDKVQTTLYLSSEIEAFWGTKDRR